MLGLDFTVKTGGGSCRRDSYKYNTIGTTCSNYYRRETIDSTHGYFTYWMLFKAFFCAFILNENYYDLSLIFLCH